MMNFLRSVRRAWPSLAVTGLMVLARNLTAAVPPPETLLPDDTLFLLSTPDFAQLREFYKTSPQTELLNDPAMKPFIDKIMDHLREEILTPLEQDLGVKFDDYTILPQGQATVALTQNNWQGTADPLPALVLLLDTKDKSSLLKTNLAALRRKWVDAGKTIKTEKIRDVEFTSYLLSPKDVPSTLKKLIAPGAGDADSATNSAQTSLVVGQVDSLLVAGTSSKVVESIVAHLAGGSAPALGGVPAFQAARLSLFRDAPFYGWANLKLLFDLFSKKPASEDPDTPNPLAAFSPDKILAATGLGGLKSLAFTAQNSADGSLVQLVVGAPAASRRGLLQLLPADGKESSPPPFVPADAVKFQRSRLDGQKIWSTFQKVMNDLSPQILNGLNFALDTANSAAKQKDPSFDIQKNLFGNLGDDLISYSKAPKGATMAEINSPPSLYLLGSPHPEELADALKSVFALMSAQGAAPAEREFLGRKIYSVPLPAGAPGSGGGAPPLLSYAASGNYVALTTTPAMLEEYLRRSDGQQKALRETPGLMEAQQQVGGASVGVFGYQNNVEPSRLLFEAVRKASASGAPASGPMSVMNFPTGAFKDWLDYSLLPPFDQVAKYFYFSVYGLSANGDVLTLKMFAPTPPGLKR